MLSHLKITLSWNFNNIAHCSQQYNKNYRLQKIKFGLGKEQMQDGSNIKLGMYAHAKSNFI